MYPDTQVQLCIVHMVRNSLKYVSWKQRKEMATDLKTIYRASTREEADDALKTFADVSALAFFFTIFARLPDCCGIAYKFDIVDMNKLKVNRITNRFTIIQGLFF